jgi:Transposase DDE domain
LPPRCLPVFCGTPFETPHGIAIERQSLGLRRGLQAIGKIAGDADRQAALGRATFWKGPEILLKQVASEYIYRAGKRMRNMHLTTKFLDAAEIRNSLAHGDPFDRDPRGALDRLDRAPKSMGVRRATVEHPFGTLKAWMGATHFKTRTLEKVRTEMSLNVLAYNLKRVIAILGAQPLMEAMRA